MNDVVFANSPREGTDKAGRYAVAATEGNDIVEQVPRTVLADLLVQRHVEPGARARIGREQGRIDAELGEGAGKAGERDARPAVGRRNAGNDLQDSHGCR